MASFGKVLDLLDDRYLELQDVTGNVELPPTLVPYERYTQNVHVYRMDTTHEVFMGLIQDFTMRRAQETGKELWTWCVQWEVDHSPPTQQPSSPKKVRLDAQKAHALSNTPQTPRHAPALTIFERRTLDGALMLEEEMLRILIDIVQVASALVPNFIEFLYRWVDYYEGDGKALKAALRWEIPSLWDFEYHPLVLLSDIGKESESGKKDNAQSSGQQDKRTRSVSHDKAAELRQSSPTKKMHARSKPDLAAIELRTFYSEESERLQYREVKFGIQPPKLEQPLPPLINIPRDQRKRTKYYAACFKSRHRALYLLLEAGVTVRQINNYQKLQTTHPKETPETGDRNGLRNYQKDAKYAQTQFELKENQIKQREIAMSNKLAAEAQFAAQTAVPDGSVGLPLIPPTPSYAKRPDMAAAMLERIRATRAKKGESVNYIPTPLLGRMKSNVFENAREKSELKPITEFMAIHGWYAALPTTEEEDTEVESEMDEFLNTSEEKEEDDDDTDMEDDGDISAATSLPAPNLPRPSLPLPLPPPPPPPPATMASIAENLETPDVFAVGKSAANSLPTPALGPADQSIPPNIATYMQNLSSEQARSLLPLSSPEARQTATSRIQISHQCQGPVPQAAIPGNINSLADHRPEGEKSGNGYMHEMVSQVPHPELPTVRPMQLLGNESWGSLSSASAAFGLPAHSSSAVSLSVVTEQQSLQKYSFKDTNSDYSPSSDQSDSGLGAEIAKPMEDVSRSLFYRQPEKNVTNPTGSGREALISAFANRDLPSQHPYSAAVTSDLAQQRRFDMLPDSPQALNTSVSSILGQPVPLIIGIQQHNTVQESRNVPVYALSPTSAGPSFTNAQPTYTGFNAEYFMQLRRQQEMPTSATTSSALPQPVQPAASAVPDTQLTLQPQSMIAPWIYRWLPAQHQGWVAADVSATNRAAPSLPLPPPLPSQPQILQPVPRPQPTHQTPLTLPYPFSAPLGAMLPPPCPGIIRNAPSPLSLSSPNSSPFTTLTSQILATSPFLIPSSNAKPPIQIYLPRILIPGNGLGPGGAKMGNGGCVETDALLLGHEEAASGRLVLSKALLLPVGVWDNTLRKVRSARWSVLETYVCPATHPSMSNGKGKGKARAGEGECQMETECHRAVYEKLVMAYGMMTSSPPAAREELLTKRWRTNRGPMTAYDRGAVWEGWAAYVDRSIEMSAVEREGAMGRDVDEAVAEVDDGDIGDGYRPYDDAGEVARRKREIQELMDEDEDTDMDD